MPWLLVAAGLLYLWSKKDVLYDGPLGEIVTKAPAPGFETSDPNYLNAAFRDRLYGLFADMAVMGHDPYIRATYRDLARQKYYHTIGWSSVDFGFHNTTTKEGIPDSLAADVSDHNSHTELEFATFYQHLRDGAARHGLYTGGSFSQSNPTWAKYQLGWDPGHVQPSGFSIASARNYERPWT